MLPSAPLLCRGAAGCSVLAHSMRSGAHQKRSAALSPLPPLPPPVPPALPPAEVAAAMRFAPAQEAYAEAEADLAAAAKKGGGKRQRKGDQPAAAAGGEAGDDEDAFFSSLSAQGRLPKFVELLKFKVGGRNEYEG